MNNEAKVSFDYNLFLTIANIILDTSSWCRRLWFVHATHGPLLGIDKPPPTGKTTILKQMRLITNTTFTPAELEYYRQLVFKNLITGMQRLVESLGEIGLSIDNDEQALAAYEVPIDPFQIPYLGDSLSHFSSTLNMPRILEMANHIL